MIGIKNIAPKMTAQLFIKFNYPINYIDASFVLDGVAAAMRRAAAR